MESAVAIDQTIQKHFHELQKPGVLFVRPGLKAQRGRVTDKPAIVVTVEKKQKGIPARDRVPRSVGGVPTDVRQASPIHCMRASNPDLWAEVAETLPPELRRPVFPFERDASGRLVAPVLEAAAAKVAARRPPKDKIKYSDQPRPPLVADTDDFKIICHASPDAGWPTLQSFLSKVGDRLTVGMYEFTATYIVQQFLTSLKTKKLSLVLDDPSDPTKRDQTDDATHAQLSAGLGKSMTFAWALEGEDPHASAQIFPAAYHIKVIVKDGSSFWLSSGNLNRSNQPEIDPIKDLAGAKAAFPHCDRDWHVIVQHVNDAGPKRLATLMETYINLDLAVAAAHQNGASDLRVVKAALNARAATPKKGSKTPTKFFAPKTITANMKIEPVFTPDTPVSYASKIIPLIRSAKKKFVMQTQYINPPKTTVGPTTPTGQADEVLESLIAAIAELIKEKVDVKLIMSEFETQDKIELLHSRGIPQKFIKIQNGVHNKGIVVDSSVVVVGSQNWSAEGVAMNRDASVIIHNAEAAKYWEGIFDHDWQHMAEATALD